MFLFVFLFLYVHTIQPEFGTELNALCWMQYYFSFSPLCWANIKIERYLLITTFMWMYLWEMWSVWNTRMTLTNLTHRRSVNIVRTERVRWYVHAPYVYAPFTLCSTVWDTVLLYVYASSYTRCCSTWISAFSLNTTVALFIQTYGSSS